jgi:hypothetical protein
MKQKIALKDKENLENKLMENVLMKRNKNITAEIFSSVRN